MPNLEELLREQETLRTIIESISSELELRPLLTRIVRHACDLLGADRGTIGLVDEVRNVVRTEAMYGMPPDEMGAEMAAGEGLAGQVLQTQRPVILNRYGDLDNPSLANMDEDAVVGLPLFWRDQMIGFFGIGAPPPHYFTEHDVATLTLFARHAAIAIENARHFDAERRRSARITTLVRIGQRITARLDLNGLFETTVEELHLRLGYDHVSLFLIDPEDPEWLVQRARGSRFRRQTTGTYRQHISQGILGQAATQRQTRIVNEVEGDTRYVTVPGAEALRAELSVPILLGDRLLGIVDIASVSPFTEEDAIGVGIIADQLAIAIDNAQLFATTQKTLDETRLLYDTSQRIGTASTVSEVVESYLRQVATRGQYACTIVLYEYDGDGNKVTRTTRGHWNPQQGVRYLNDRYTYEPDALDPTLDAGETVTLGDVHTDPRAPDTLREMQRESKRPALALIPLMVRGRRIGLVVLSDIATRIWSESDLHPYQVTAAQLAIAIDNRRQSRLLYQQGQQLAVFEERQRLARELHDSVAQLVFSSTLIAQSITPAWRRDAAEGEKRVNRLLELSQAALVEMRALLTELRPPENTEPSPIATQAVPLPGIARVQREGLTTALAAHIANVMRDGVSIGLDANEYAPQPLPQEEALYRITQEALNNVVKHARASHVQIRLISADDGTHLTIRDNGVGFGSISAADRAKKPTSFGLHTMRERAEALGGHFMIDSNVGKGTTVEVTLPYLTHERNER